MAHRPMKFRYVLGKLPPTPRILDIGCANNSPRVTKRWFPGCHYAGADIRAYDESEAGASGMDAFFLLGVDGGGYDAIPDGSYDLVILNHVVEHMANPGPVLATLCGKLKPGGYMWIAFPSVRSLGLPSSFDETLQFCDDATHVYVPDLREIANVLLANGVKVLHAGRSREGWFTRVADVLKLGKRMVKWAVTGRFSGRGMWYVMGFEDHVFGRRRGAE